MAATWTTLDLVKSDTYSPVERRDISELQETARVKKKDLFPFFMPPPPLSPIAECREEMPQRRVYQESINEQVKRRFDKIMFNSPTFNLIHCKDVQPEGLQDAPPQAISQPEDTQEPQPSLALCQPKPSEIQTTELKTFFDPEYNSYYFKPIPFGEVARFVENFQVEGGYSGLCCGRLRKLKNLTKSGYPEERCDIIALTKDRRQVEYEAKITKGNFVLGIIKNICDGCTDFQSRSVKKWQAKQAEACGQIVEALQTKKEEWHYDSFMIADEKMLIELGYIEEDAKKIHLLALFYKKVPMQP